MDEDYDTLVHHYFRETVGGAEGEQLWQVGQHITDPQQRKAYYDHCICQIEHGWQSIANLKRQPVGIDTFIKDPYYLNKAAEIYPKILEELTEINNGSYVEAIFTGGIGSGKTTGALYSIAYQLYLLSCYENPHLEFGLDSASEILLVFQSLNAVISKASYKRFKAMIEDSPYFRENFYFDKAIDSRLIFPNRIEVVPVSGMETAVIGQNVIGGMIDELNYMNIVTKSKQSVDQGTYNQAVALYNSIARRRKSRFVGKKQLPGLLCLVSSKRYPGQFTDIKEEEAKRDPTIYIYDYRVWDVKPAGTFNKGTFNVFAGDLTRKPRILLADEVVHPSDAALVVPIPMEFREDFESDIINALREIAGVSTLARHPYFVDVEKVSAVFGQHQSIFNREDVDFVTTKLAIYPKRFYKPELPRFAHIDLALSGDSAGLTIGCCSGFVSMRQQGYGNAEEMLPKIHIDGQLEIRPPKNGEILFWKIRDVLTALRNHGLNLRWITFDSWQSKDSQQLLKQAGFTVGEQSVDTTNKPYDFLKSAIYSGRLAAPPHAKCKVELVSLEKDTKTGKIDHPMTGSKDVSDSLAGVVYGISMRREIWAMYNVALLKLPDGMPVIEHEAAMTAEAGDIVIGN